MRFAWTQLWIICGAEVGIVAGIVLDGTERWRFASVAVAGGVGFLKLSDVGVSVVVGVDSVVVMVRPVPMLRHPWGSTVTLASNIATAGTLDTWTDIALVSGCKLHRVVSRVSPSIE